MELVFCRLSFFAASGFLMTFLSLNCCVGSGISQADFSCEISIWHRFGLKTAQNWFRSWAFSFFYLFVVIFGRWKWPICLFHNSNMPYFSYFVLFGNSGSYFYYSLLFMKCCFQLSKSDFTTWYSVMRISYSNSCVFVDFVILAILGRWMPFLPISLGSWFGRWIPC